MLGIQADASLDEIKFAFRREASKWHPDKAGDAQEAKQNFQALNQAYQMLKGKNRNFSESAAYTTSAPPDYEIDSIDGEVWDTLFEYALSLTRTGMSPQDVADDIRLQGYAPLVAHKLSDKAAKYLRRYPSEPDAESPGRRKSTFFKSAKIDDKLSQAFLGGDYPFTGSRKMRQTINYYQDVFRDLYQNELDGSWLPANKNRYLFKLLTRSVLLFSLIAAVVFYFPFLTTYIPLDVFDLFQLPNMVLSLMLVWAMSKKLWGLSLLGLIFFSATQMYFYYSMPGSLADGIGKVAMTGLVGFIPFILLVYFSNYIYYQKARGVIESVCLDYYDEVDRRYFIKKKGSTSKAQALLIAIPLTLYFLHVVPENGSLNEKINWVLSGGERRAENSDIIQAQKKTLDTGQLFAQAEYYYNQQPADYQQAVPAYADAARSGSLLAAYKLGYMYLHGLGVPQDDARALDYFQHAVDSPLSSQPHSLALTTGWLAESYNSLGIMYLGGYAVARDQNRARRMFLLAKNFGSSRVVSVLSDGRQLAREQLLGFVAVPDFN